LGDRYRFEDNIRKDRKRQIRSGVVDWINLSQNHLQFQAFVTKIMKFQILQNAENSLRNYIALEF
jgi:hypothetical protein